MSSSDDDDWNIPVPVARQPAHVHAPPPHSSTGDGHDDTDMMAARRRALQAKRNNAPSANEPSIKNTSSGTNSNDIGQNIRSNTTVAVTNPQAFTSAVAESDLPSDLFDISVHEDSSNNNGSRKENDNNNETGNVGTNDTNDANSSSAMPVNAAKSTDIPSPSPATANDPPYPLPSNHAEDGVDLTTLRHVLQERQQQCAAARARLSDVTEDAARRRRSLYAQLPPLEHQLREEQNRLDEEQAAAQVARQQAEESRLRRLQKTRVEAEKNVQDEYAPMLHAATRALERAIAEELRLRALLHLDSSAADAATAPPSSELVLHAITAATQKLLARLQQRWGCTECEQAGTHPIHAPSASPHAPRIHNTSAQNFVGSDPDHSNDDDDGHACKADDISNSNTDHSSKAITMDSRYSNHDRDERGGMSCLRIPIDSEWRRSCGAMVQSEIDDSFARAIDRTLDHTQCDAQHRLDTLLQLSESTARAEWHTLRDMHDTWLSQMQQLTDETAKHTQDQLTLVLSTYQTEHGRLAEVHRRAHDAALQHMTHIAAALSKDLQDHARAMARRLQQQEAHTQGQLASQVQQAESHVAEQWERTRKAQSGLRTRRTQMERAARMALHESIRQLVPTMMHIRTITESLQSRHDHLEKMQRTFTQARAESAQRRVEKWRKWVQLTEGECIAVARVVQQCQTVLSVRVRGAQQLMQQHMHAEDGWAQRQRAANAASLRQWQQSLRRWREGVTRAQSAVEERFATVVSALRRSLAETHLTHLHAMPMNSGDNTNGDVCSDGEDRHSSDVDANSETSKPSLRGKGRRSRRNGTEGTSVTAPPSATYGIHSHSDTTLDTPHGSKRSKRNALDSEDESLTVTLARMRVELAQLAHDAVTTQSESLVQQEAKLAVQQQQLDEAHAALRVQREQLDSDAATLRESAAAVRAVRWALWSASSTVAEQRGQTAEALARQKVMAMCGGGDVAAFGQPASVWASAAGTGSGVARGKNSGDGHERDEPPRHRHERTKLSASARRKRLPHVVLRELRGMLTQTGVAREPAPSATLHALPFAMPSTQGYSVPIKPVSRRLTEPAGRMDLTYTAKPAHGQHSSWNSTERSKAASSMQVSKPTGKHDTRSNSHADTHDRPHQGNQRDDMPSSLQMKDFPPAHQHDDVPHKDRAKHTSHRHVANYPSTTPQRWSDVLANDDVLGVNRELSARVRRTLLSPAQQKIRRASRDRQEGGRAVRSAGATRSTNHTSATIAALSDVVVPAAAEAAAPNSITNPTTARMASSSSNSQLETVSGSAGRTFLHLTDFSDLDALANSLAST